MFVSQNVGAQYMREIFSSRFQTFPQFIGMASYEVRIKQRSSLSSGC
jgi:hypothetical protein